MEGILSGASLKGSVTLWDLRIGSPVRQYRQAPPTKKGCIGILGESFIILASDKKLNASGQLKDVANSKTIAWSFENEALHSQSYIPHPISSLIGTPCSQYIIAGTSGGSLIIWHAPSGRLIHLFGNAFQPITTLTINPSSEWLAIGCTDGIIHILRLNLLISGKIAAAEKITFSNHSLPISDLKFSSTSQRFYSSSLDQTVKIWSIGGSSLLCSIFFPTVLNCIALSPMEDNIYVGGADGNVYKFNFWDLKSSDINLIDNLQNMPQIFEGKSSVNCIDVNIDGSILVTGTDDGNIRIWSSSTNQLLQIIHQEKGPINTIKIVLKNSTVMSPGYIIESKIRPSLSPLSTLPYSGPSDSLPIKLPPTNYEDSDFINHKKEISKNIESATNKFMLKDDLLEKIEYLNNELKQLNEVNKRWKTLNNKLLETTLSNI